MRGAGILCPSAGAAVQTVIEYAGTTRIQSAFHHGLTSEHDKVRTSSPSADNKNATFDDAQ